ncbi:MAG: alpha/beta hydrolase family protein [Chitinophagaceae bacterium]
MKKIILAVALALILLDTNAATVDTISIYSTAMHKDYKCVVIKPVMVQDETIPLPVVYLLHGHGGWYANWLLKVPELKEMADKYKVLIVCPDGGYNSWYLDSPVDSTVRFETYISKEVPAYIDTHYPTIRDRKARAITGLSMGGHGGLFLGFRHAETFGACGSMSGGVDLRPFPKNWQLSQRLGDTATYAGNWKNYSVTTVIEKKPSDSLAIIIDCGTEDFFYTVNHALHLKMVQLNIAHDYIERPGKHDWAYWENAVKYQLLYFSDYFNSSRKN